MKETTLTREEKELIGQIGCDLESGNHLLRPRSDRYWEFMKEFQEAMKAKEPTEKQRYIKEYYHQCADYFFWKNLPDEEKMF